ncbi:Lrp/AsnC family transcriptional regulator [Acinetobacter corruptisaponis]|uniref:Lrp/AsnC family transcriptional regulator n=1 Tax=Acinetobacter corruptisaponis TaxID=3045147 RepID=A0ABY8S4J6_9GAMM|nr:Lrp/AsnC family transcriptional regulator [Acinetobacter sp. KCTC 92772]WHP05772.1 Lrp/AsnC family transcriptional regulator [Acinetobacter sp. KCTC 92772]
MHSTGHPAVDQMADINIEGNVIPVNWYQAFKMENGKPDLNAIIILSEIVYWYRPAVIRCENTGRQLGIKKRFKYDMLQRSYESFSDQFGLSKLQVKEATDRLEKCQVIKKHFRTVGNLSNVLFIELIPIKLLEFSSIKSVDSGDTLPRSNVTPSHDETGDLPSSNVPPSHVQTDDLPCSNEGHIQRIHTEITTEKKQPVYSEEFDIFWKAYPTTKRKGSKADAFKIFQKYKSHADLINKILELFKLDQDWIKQDGDFIPAPSSWLNKKHWENEFWINRINQTQNNSTPEQQQDQQQPQRFTPEPMRFGQGLV